MQCSFSSLKRGDNPDHLTRTTSVAIC